MFNFMQSGHFSTKMLGQS